MDFSILSSAVSAGNATFNFVKNAVAARDQAKIEAGTAELEVKMREINQAAFHASQDALKATQAMRTMDNEMAALERENAELKAKADDRKRYTLVDIGRQQFAYALRTNALREIDTDPTPKYYLCQPCMDSDQKVVLQGDGSGSGLKCPRCELTLNPDRYIGPNVAMSAAPRSRGY